MKILIFCGIFIFQIYFYKKIVWPFIISVYIDLTEKIPEVIKFHTQASGSPDKFILIRHCKRSSQISILSLDNFLLNSIFSGLLVKTCDARTFLRRTMLYGEGNSSANDQSPNHVSSQKRVLWPLPTFKKPREKKSSLTPIIPFQNGE
jgi:hypothetical protein